MYPAIHCLITPIGEPPMPGTRLTLTGSSLLHHKPCRSVTGDRLVSKLAVTQTHLLIIGCFKVNLFVGVLHTSVFEWSSLALGLSHTWDSAKSRILTTAAISWA